MTCTMTSLPQKKHLERMTAVTTSDNDDKSSSSSSSTQHVVTEIKVRRGELKELLGERIRNSESLVQLTNVATQEEMDFLKESSVKYAGRIDQRNADRNHCCVRLPNFSARLGDVQVGSDHGVLGKPESAVMDTILERVFTAMDNDELICPSVKANLFFDDEGAEVSVTELFRNNQLEFSMREPAMNVYFPGGHFGLHKDGRTLTILVALSDPDKDYEHGGTAFWKEEYAVNGRHDPRFTLRPKPGTALVFGGAISHKGMHNTKGTRVIIVGSFSRRPRSSTMEGEKAQ